jgi:hypothetical protein
LRRSIAYTDSNRDGNSDSKRYAYRNGNSDCGCKRYAYGDGNSNGNADAHTYSDSKSYPNAQTRADAEGATNAAAETIVGPRSLIIRELASHTREFPAGALAISVHARGRHRSSRLLGRPC